MKNSEGLLVLFLITSISCYDCELDLSFQERIDKDLYYLRDGVSPSMLAKARVLDDTVTFTVREHKMTYSPETRIEK
jgi:hypothetical protein